MAELAVSTWPQVERSAPLTLVVPLGSLEQHGPHLPLATDTLIASYVASAIAREIPRCALAPAISIGASGEHAGFAGTLSIGTDALTTLLIELSRDASREYERVVLVNGHGGNGPAIAAAQEICRAESRVLDVAHCHFPGADAHAGRTETSVLLHIAPELVRLDLAAPGNADPIASLMPAMRAGGVRAVSHTGVLGDPRGASGAAGERLLSALVHELVTRLL